MIRLICHENWRNKIVECTSFRKERWFHSTIYLVLWPNATVCNHRSSRWEVNSTFDFIYKAKIDVMKWVEIDNPSINYCKVRTLGEGFTYRHSEWISWYRHAILVMNSFLTCIPIHNISVCMYLFRNKNNWKKDFKCSKCLSTRNIVNWKHKEVTIDRIYTRMNLQKINFVIRWSGKRNLKVNITNWRPIEKISS